MFLSTTLVKKIIYLNFQCFFHFQTQKSPLVVTSLNAELKMSKKNGEKSTASASASFVLKISRCGSMNMATVSPKCSGTEII